MGGRDIVGFIIFSLFMALVLQVSAEACDTVGWNSEDRQCPKGQIEIYKDVRTRSGTTNRMCCKPATVKARQEKIRAEGCYATDCLPSTSDKPCVDTTERYVDGKLVEYEEAMRGKCSRGKGSDPGFLAVCCAKNSTEGLLISTLGAEPNEFPHQVKLKLPGQCGGTIYNSRWIITAAHCVVHNGTRDPVSKMKVVIGTNIASMYTEDYVYRVKSAIPRFNYSKLEWPNNLELDATEPRSFNDIALLELDRDIVFTDKIKALEIAPENFDPFEYSDKAVIVGWGTSDTASTTIHLQKANFLLRSDYKCFDKKIGKRKRYSGFEDSLLCVGGILDGKWSNIAGKGDSGGPAICRNKP